MCRAYDTNRRGSVVSYTPISTPFRMVEENRGTFSLHRATIKGASNRGAQRQRQRESDIDRKRGRERMTDRQAEVGKVEY